MKGEMAKSQPSDCGRSREGSDSLRYHPRARPNSSRGIERAKDASNLQPVLKRHSARVVEHLPDVVRRDSTVAQDGSVDLGCLRRAVERRRDKVVERFWHPLRLVDPRVHDLAGAQPEQDDLAVGDLEAGTPHRPSPSALQPSDENLLDHRSPLSSMSDPVDGASSGDRASCCCMPASLAEVVVVVDGRWSEGAVEREDVEAVFHRFEDCGRLRVGLSKKVERVGDPSSNVDEGRSEAQRLGDEGVEEREGREQQREPQRCRRDEGPNETP